MDKIAYNGMELDEVTEPQIFDPPRTMLVWGDCSGHVEDHIKKAEVVAILPRTALKYPIITEDDDGYEHGAFIPEKPAPRMVPNRELAKWLAQGNGEVLSLMPTTNGHPREVVTTDWYYFSGDDSKTVDYGFEGQRCKGVRKWDDEEWHTPDVEYMGITEVKTYEDVVKREG